MALVALSRRSFVLIGFSSQVNLGHPHHGPPAALRRPRPAAVHHAAARYQLDTSRPIGRGRYSRAVDAFLIGRAFLAVVQNPGEYIPPEVVLAILDSIGCLDARGAVDLGGGSVEEVMLLSHDFSSRF